MRICLLIASLLSMAAYGQTSSPPESDQPFTIRISAIDSQVMKGNKVKLRVVLTNTSNSEVDGSKAYRSGLNIAYMYEIRDPWGRRLSTRNLNPSVAATFERHMLDPRGSIEDLTDLSPTYDMTQPGDYTIQLSRADRAHRGELVKSNTITVTVLPVQ